MKPSAILIVGFREDGRLEWFNLSSLSDECCPHWEPTIGKLSLFYGRKLLLKAWNDVIMDKNLKFDVSYWHIAPFPLSWNGFHFVELSFTFAFRWAILLQTGLSPTWRLDNSALDSSYPTTWRGAFWLSVRTCQMIAKGLIRIIYVLLSSRMWSAA